MRIDPTTIAAITPPRERPMATAAAPKAHDPAAVVSLGQGATALQASSTDPGITTRIARIRELLADGDYVVDLDQLAGRILDDDEARSAS